jgi:superfamily II DNA or RNA helicase
MNTTPLFRTLVATESKPESPVLMFRDLKRDQNIKFLWGHQEKTLDSYFQSYRDASDIAIELPTGTGKTLVGLLIGEYRRRALDERVAFLCSTRQLCAQ